jgi:hypothetical protein
MNYPIVKGGPGIVEISHKLFAAPHTCRCCKAVFYPQEPRKIYLCAVCELIPQKVRRQAVAARSILKREGRKVRHKDGSFTIAPIITREDCKKICDSRLEGVDRGTRDGARRYWMERSWHFTELHHLPATPENIGAVRW